MVSPLPAKARQSCKLIPNVPERLQVQSFIEEGMTWPPTSQSSRSGGQTVDYIVNDARPATDIPSAQTKRGSCVEMGVSHISIHSNQSTFLSWSLRRLTSEFLRSFAVAILVLTFQWNWGGSYRVTNEGTTVQSVDSPQAEAEAVVSAPNYTELFDFASIDAGGYHIPALTSHGRFPRRYRSLDFALTSSLDDCWLLPRNVGHIGVSLPSPIVVTHITIDHALTTPSGTNDAPRGMIVWGLVEGQTNFQRYNSRPQIRGLSYTTPTLTVVQASNEINPSAFFIELGHLQYRQGGGNPLSQTFPIHEDVVETGLDFGIVVLEIRGNWGGEHTCLYRFRVHGQKAEADA